MAVRPDVAALTDFDVPPAGGAVPQVVQPDRREALTADEPDESAGQVPVCVGTAARVGEDVPVARRRQLLVAVGGKDLQGPDAVAGHTHRRFPHRPQTGPELRRRTASYARNDHGKDTTTTRP